MQGQSVASVVHDVLRSAREPLTVREILERVKQHGPVRTADPLATVRGALSVAPQLVNVGDGRFGYLPWLINGSVLRMPLTVGGRTHHQLVYTDDVRHALFPSFFDSASRKLTRLSRLRLPEGNEIELALEHIGDWVWGSSVPDMLRRYLAAQGALAGDSLLIRVLDGEAGAYQASIDSRQQRNNLAVEERNRALAVTVEGLFRRSRSHEMSIWEIVVALLARGAYRGEPAPDPIEVILAATPGFACDDFGIWRLDTAPADRRLPRGKTRWQPVEAGVRARARDVLATLQARGDRVRPDTSSVGARSRGAAIQEASRLLRELLDAEHMQRRTRRRRRRVRSQVYQVKCTVKGIKPPIWRRLHVHSDISLAMLHNVVQLAIGWSDSHLHDFVVDGVPYTTPDVDGGGDVEDEREVLLLDVAPSAGARLLYRYDFGDGWECDLLVERALDPANGAVYPLCLTGKRAGPPEDVGGVWGYSRLLEALSDPKHPEHRWRLEWIGGQFDAERFDVASVNASLRKFLQHLT